MAEYRKVCELRRDLLEHAGIVSFREQDRIIDIAKRCARTAGVATAGGWAVLGSSVPGYGTVAGFLAGWVVGTGACVAVNRAMREQLRELASCEDPGYDFMK